MKFAQLSVLLLLIFGCKNLQNTSSSTSYEDLVSKYQKYEGFFNFYWDKTRGKIFLEVDRLDEEFIYVNYLAAGIGSNDIGLDRGQLGDTRIVKFSRSGPKLVLMQPNYGYRAISDNQNEVRSVEEAFAQSILWGFKIEKEKNGKLLIDITDFLLSDAHGVTQRLKATKQGSYKLDADRSFIYLPQTKNFEKNTDFEATLTFKGEPEGTYIQSVTPTPQSVTVRTHHSFVEVPDNKYEPRKYDPRSGFFGISYQDYATPIDKPLVKRFIQRHRLEKKNPGAAISEPFEPIIYYVDKGAPEPVRSALIEGASWWNEAFEAAGYKNAFQVKVLPDSADPLDIRYNVIQWVHRSTRGWSYGTTITDPRTGEIIKGHVSLGSLRIRQDFLIATGLLQPYEDGEGPSDEMLQMALARLRQLSAHEVGHTLGLNHNFAASVNDRASVMDYPHPYIKLNNDGSIDLSEAYDTGIGEWDKYTIRYGYASFSEESDPVQVIDEWISKGYQYITDADARPIGGAHPNAHLWDNGTNAATELDRLRGIRQKVITSFSEKVIQKGQPYAEIEEAFVPMYFLHRYQIESAAKLLGGVNYSYKVKGDKLPLPQRVSTKDQSMALSALAATITTDFLDIPESVRNILSPRVPGYPASRETFNSKTGPTFDPVAAAETSAEMTLRMIFNPERMERVLQQNYEDSKLPGWSAVMQALYMQNWANKYPEGLPKAIRMAVEKRIFYHLLNLASSDNATERVKARALLEVETLIQEINEYRPADPKIIAHYNHVKFLFEQFKKEPSDFKFPKAQDPPDGSPIGMMCD